MGGTGCGHGGGRPCAWPGCPAGVAGERRVVAGPEAVEYFARTLDVEGVGPGLGRLVVRWRLVRRDARQHRRAACGT